MLSELLVCLVSYTKCPVLSIFLLLNNASRKPEYGPKKQYHGMLCCYLSLLLFFFGSKCASLIKDLSSIVFTFYGATMDSPARIGSCSSSCLGSPGALRDIRSDPCQAPPAPSRQLGRWMCLVPPPLDHPLSAFTEHGRHVTISRESNKSTLNKDAWKIQPQAQWLLPKFDPHSA